MLFGAIGAQKVLTTRKYNKKLAIDKPRNNKTAAILGNMVAFAHPHTRSAAFSHKTRFFRPPFVHISLLLPILHTQFSHLYLCGSFKFLFPCAGCAFV